MYGRMGPFYKGTAIAMSYYNQQRCDTNQKNLITNMELQLLDKWCVRATKALFLVIVSNGGYGTYYATTPGRAALINAGQRVLYAELLRVNLHIRDCWDDVLEFDVGSCITIDSNGKWGRYQG